MSGLQSAGRWLFVILAGLSGLLLVQALVQSHDTDSRHLGPRFVWIGVYLIAAIGVLRWKSWGYLPAIVAAVASLFFGVKRFPASQNRAIDGVMLLLWLACLLWLWMPGVRERFKPVTK